MRIDSNICPILKSVAEIGDKWILMILREAFLRTRRFDDFYKHLNISKSVLSQKLQKMLDLELLEKVAYKNDKERQRFEYKLTQKGKDSYKISLALLEWGNKYLVKSQEVTIEAIDKNTNEKLELILVNQSGEPVAQRDIQMTLGIKE